MSAFSISEIDSKKEVDVILDVSSHSVGGALVIFQNKPKILWSHRLYLPLQAQDKTSAEKLIMKKLDELLKAIIKVGVSELKVSQMRFREKRINRIYCVISSPWCRGEVKTISKNEEKPVEISSKFLEEIFEKEEASQKDSHVLIERKLIKIKLNGYETENPISKKARNIDLAIFEGQVEKTFLQQLEEVIGRQIHGDIAFHSHTLSVFSVVEDVFPENKDYLLIEITGESTEVSIIKSGLIKDSFTLPKGKNLFLKSIAQKFNVENDVALSFIKLYYENKAEKNFHEEIEKAVQESEREWIFDLKESFRQEDFIPRTVVLSVDPLFSPFFTKYLKVCIKESINTEASIIYLGTEALGQFINFKSGEYDPFLTVGALSIRRVAD